MNRGAAILAAGITALVITGAALAAKPVTGSSQSNTIKLVMLADDGARAAASAQPTFGDQITYELSTAATEPYVETSCFQNGTLVSKQSRGFFDGYYAGTQVFTLGPTSLWQGGAAKCQARLVVWVNGNARTLASMSFDVAA